MVQLMHLYAFQTNVMQLNLVFTIIYFSEKLLPERQYTTNIITDPVQVKYLLISLVEKFEHC